MPQRRRGDAQQRQQFGHHRHRHRHPGGCNLAPTETEGPFPTHTPASYVRADIRDGKTGYALEVENHHHQ